MDVSKMSLLNSAETRDLKAALADLFTEEKNHTFQTMERESFLDMFFLSWGSLDYEILVKIFMKLCIMDLIYGASGVCACWRAACRDPRLWKTLDVKKFNSGFPNFRPRRCNLLTLTEPRGVRLMNVLAQAINLSRCNVTRLIFDFNECVTDEHLMFVVERCSKNLKQLVVPAWNQMTANGLCNAIRHLTKLESLTLPCNFCPTRVIEVVGACCANLYELKLMCPYDYEIATTLFVYIPTLKVLSLRCSLVSKDALDITLMVFDFDVFNLSHSLIVDKDQQGSLVPLSWKNNGLIHQKARNFKNFFACSIEGCIICKLVLKDSGRLKWHEYEEELWRKDEVMSLSV